MILGAILCGQLLLAPSASDVSDDAYVREVARRVATHMEAEHYAAALREIEAAESTRPLSDFVFMRALVEEERGNCRAAVPLYDRFLESGPLPKDAEAARAGRIRCGAEAEPGPEPTPVSPHDPPPPTPKPWYGDPVGGTLVIGGTVALGAGLGLFVQARADERAAERADTLAAHERLGDRASKLGIAAVSVLATGGALVVGGVIRYVVVARRGGRGARKVAIGPGLTVRF